MKLRNKFLLSIVLIFVLSLSLTGCAKDTKGTLTIGINAEFPPFEYVNDDGDFDGFDIALMKAIGEETGYEIKFKNMEFKSLVSSIKTGGIDASISGMTITEDRKESVDFTDSYYKATQYIILPKGSDVDDISDLAGKKVAVQEGTTGDFLVSDETIVADVTVQRYKKGADAVIVLKNGSVDAVVIDKNPALKFVEANTEDLITIPENSSVEEYGIALQKGNTKLLESFNKALKTLKENGTYEDLVNTYITNDPSAKKEVSDNFFTNLINKFKFVFINNNGYKLLLKGLSNTLLISAAGVLLGVALGFILALMKLTAVRNKKPTLLSRIAGMYIDIIRGTPVIVQLLIIYLIVFKSDLGVIAAIVTFGINSGAYVAEIIRAGIMAVDSGQMEGGRSLGFSYSQSMRYIIVPQAIKNILPALCNEFIALIKETSIVGYVAVADLTKASDFIISRTYEPFMPLIAIAIIYYIIVKILSYLFGKLERRLRKSDNR